MGRPGRKRRLVSGGIPCEDVGAPGAVGGEDGWEGNPVRDWLARFTSRAELVRGVFTVWLCALDADPPPLPPAGSAVADAVAAVTAAAAAAGRRWAGRLVSLSPGELASSVSAGALLAPGFTAELINTSPF
jgi:hypothetical protein